MRSDRASRPEVNTGPPGPAWARVAVIAALVAGAVAPVLVGLDWFSGWYVQTRLPGPPPERLGWEWVTGIAATSGLAAALYAEWRLRRGVRSPAEAKAEGAAPDAESGPAEDRGVGKLAPRSTDEEIAKLKARITELERSRDSDGSL